MDSNYNSETVIPAASNSDRKQRRMAASTNEMVKIASKDAGISLKESILLSYDKMIFHLNEHTNGFKYRAYWCKHNMLTTNKTHYQLVMTRDNKRHLAQILKNRVRDYVEGN